jgi:hypothetical protein
VGRVQKPQGTKAAPAAGQPASNAGVVADVQVLQLLKNFKSMLLHAFQGARQAKS